MRGRVKKALYLVQIDPFPLTSKLKLLTAGQPAILLIRVTPTFFFCFLCFLSSSSSIFFYFNPINNSLAAFVLVVRSINETPDIVLRSSFSYLMFQSLRSVVFLYFFIASLSTILLLSLFLSISVLLKGIVISFSLLLVSTKELAISSFESFNDMLTL